MTEVEGLNKDKKLEEILKMVPLIINYQKYYEDIRYLTNLNAKENHENLIYELYSPTFQLTLTSTQKFNDFTAENHETF